MDLTNLRDSLDSSSRERHPAMASAKQSEVRLTRDFKAAAMQLTTLYRTSLSSAKRSYATGYAQSLSDILDVVLLRLQQTPESAPGYEASTASSSAASSPSSSSLSATMASSDENRTRQDRRDAGRASEREELKWLVRYMRARIEAIKVECEDEEREESDEEETVEGEALSSGGGKHNNNNVIDITVSRAAETNGPNAGMHTETLRNSEPSDRSEMDVAKVQGCAADDEMRIEQEQSNNGRNRPSVPSTAFTFSQAGGAVASSSANAKRRARNANGSASANQHATTVSSSASNNNNSSNNATPFIRAASSSEEEDSSARPTSAAVAQAARSSTTSSRRSQSRLGKRLGGREKLSGLDFFARSQHAKRRRGAGDRRDDDFDDALL